MEREPATPLWIAPAENQIVPNNASISTLAKASIAAGLLAATVEMIFVLPIQYQLGASPAVVFQSIASGALGKRAFDEGMSAVLLGVGVHILISLVSAALFTAAAFRWDFLRRRAIVSGALYGVLAYVVMNFLVIPISAIGFRWPRSLPLFCISLAIHMFAFGVPIALVCARYLRDPKQ
jgi:uncharacterized membrane protein YagU involved in acid resistance